MGYVNMSFLSSQLIQCIFWQLVGLMTIMGDAAWKGTMGFLFILILCNECYVNISLNAFYIFGLQESNFSLFYLIFLHSHNMLHN